MKIGFTRRGQKGFTLIELVIVLAVIGVLAAIVIPNVSGFVGRGKERAWEADRNILQAAVDAYRTDIGNRSGNAWPLVTGPPWVLGKPTVVAGAVTVKAGIIDVTKLYNATAHEQNYLKGTDTVRSAYKTENLSTQAQDGSYIWYIDVDGVVKSILYDRNLATPKVDDTKIGFQTNVYP
ncbi:MAG: prepilin-type N-terminal cleavage/methylation domain-containing protein [Dehalococcoidia bacterium]|nr:prepilin-type N-terminal cleavage/methylation domain-containing protein [Dehalococcoidia bacterium]